MTETAKIQSILTESPTGVEDAKATAQKWWNLLWHNIHTGRLPKLPGPGHAVPFPGFIEVETPPAPALVIGDVPMPPAPPPVEATTEEASGQGTDHPAAAAEGAAAKDDVKAT